MSLRARTLAIGLAAAGVLATHAPAAGAAPTLRWAPCHEGFECATAHVPRDHARPAARSSSSR